MEPFQYRRLINLIKLMSILNLMLKALQLNGKCMIFSGMGRFGSTNQRFCPMALAAATPMSGLKLAKAR